jgi:serine/threonine protein kinase/Tol biopolymer transport system component
MTETLSPNTTLSHYQIVSKLGAGGMGEVYRAKDTRLAREVAVKVLPADFAKDAERLRRFEQEARATSALNHPNILTIYDIGTHDGTPYIVSELLDGEEMRAQLNDGALPARKAVDYATQVARGLAAAHEKGIVHRDLKPENLFITSDGRVKILDFGLAKLKPQPGGGVLPEAATAVKPTTDPGIVMGTVGYMSPEQVRGQEADHRADIFSFGAILYEMLAGTRAFRRETMAETMTAILKEEPPELTDAAHETRGRRGMISPQLERIVRRCLEKKPERRFQSASDLGFALEALSSPSAGSGSSPVAKEAGWKPAHPGGWRERLAWIVAAVLLLGLLASLPFTVAHLRHAPVEIQTSRFFVSPPEKSTLGTVTVSPDGRRLAFIARDAAGKTLLWVRPLDSLAAHPLVGTDNASDPFWSPDSRFIGFFAGGKLKKVEATGGPPSTLCNAPDGRGGAWNRDDVIIFAPYYSSGLSRVSASGGEPSPVTTLNSSRQEDSHRFPQFLPDGRHFLYFARSTQPENSAIYVGALDQPQAKRIISANTNVAYAPPGYLLFPREGTLMAQAFDVASLELTGAPFRIAEQVGYNRLYNEAYFSVSDTGGLVYQSGGAKTQLVWFDRSGKQLGSPGPPGDYGFLALSPDEKRVAVEGVDAQTGTYDIWLLDLARGIPSRFTFDPASDSAPTWSPDGSRIVFASNRDGVINLYQKLSSGAGSEEAILKSGGPKWPHDWSVDGRFILYEQISPNTQSDLWVLPLFGDRQPFPFLQTKFNEWGGDFSPDARWIAYQSDESGSVQMYVQSFPPGSKWQISSEGGSWPRFRRDGKELFYLAANGKLMVVELKANASGLEFSVPKPLFETHATDRYAVSADGQRFLLNTPVEESTAAPITVVLNWTAEVKR